MRTTAGPTRVDVIYRRVDDEFLDPLQFRADSMLGSPGLMLAARLGNVTIANAVGNGVADDKLVYTYVPDLIRYYLAEEPILPNVDTWRLEEPGALEEVLDRLDELVVKPVDGSGGKGLVVGPDASPAELETLRKRLLADPRGWIAQPVVQLSTIPTLVEDGMRPRHVDLRPFAVNDGDDVWVLPGGLTRVALPEGQLVVNPRRAAARRTPGWSAPGHVAYGAEPRTSQGLVADQAATSRRAIPIIYGRAPACRTTIAAGPLRAHAASSRSSSSSSAHRGGRSHAEPHRRVAVLDRPLHRARRRHRAHPRRAPAAAARGPVDRRGHRLPLAAERHGHRGRPTPRDRRRADVLAILAVDRNQPGVASRTR